MKNQWITDRVPENDSEKFVFYAAGFGYARWNIDLLQWEEYTGTMEHMGWEEPMYKVVAWQEKPEFDEIPDWVYIANNQKPAKESEEITFSGEVIEFGDVECLNGKSGMLLEVSREHLKSIAKSMLFKEFDFTASRKLSDKEIKNENC